MSADEGSSGPSQRIGLGRLEAFSDGVFAIAITLLVLEIAVHPPGTPLEQFLHAWPSYLGYVVSFLTIGAAWLAHSDLTDRLTRSDPIFQRINLLFLLAVTFLPFPTRLVAEGLHERDAERVAVTVYGLTLLAIRVLLIALDGYARRVPLYSVQTEGEEQRAVQRRSLVAVICYLLVILLGLLLPRLAVALYFALAVYLVLPSRHVVARLRSQPSGPAKPPAGA
jgi:uncharacterized membrane protein